VTTIQENTILLDIVFRIMIPFLTVYVLSKYEGCCLKFLAQPFFIRYFDEKKESPVPPLLDSILEYPFQPYTL